LVVDLDWRGVRALGYPRATATVLDNLLRNTHRHAPGARALVTARTVGSRVEIVVSDDGPGIPSDERDGVLRAGVRGSRARGAGSGFGLYSAARAMTAQGGSLRIGSAPSGGTRVVLRMPAASARHAMAS
jgi:signal transduction histidine kinase